MPSMMKEPGVYPGCCLPIIQMIGLEFGLECLARAWSVMVNKQTLLPRKVWQILVLRTTLNESRFTDGRGEHLKQALRGNLIIVYTNRDSRMRSSTSGGDFQFHKQTPKHKYLFHPSRIPFYIGSLFPPFSTQFSHRATPHTKREPSSLG